MKKSLFILFAALILPLAKANSDTYTQGTSSVTLGAFINGVKITTGNVILDHIDIMSAGSADAAVSVYDSALSSNTALKSYEGWSASSARIIDCDIELSTGLIVSSTGTTPARVIWKYRRLSRN